MIKKFWRWLKNLLTKLFSPTKAKHKLKTINESVPLSDLDYEFLFNQLLVGVGHGWHEGRIVKFFDQLGDRTRERDWVEWLDRFALKVMPNAANNQQLGAVMMRLGEQTQSIPTLSRLGEQSYRIGRNILTYQIPPEIWEYGGPDATLTQIEPPPQDADGWFELGLKQADAGLLAEAIASWDEALKIDPNLDSVWHNRGAAFGQLGKFEEAIACFDEAINIRPEVKESWQDKAFALYQLEKFEEAIACWDKLLELAPEHYQAWYNRGCALEILGQSEAAKTSYQKALEIEPDFEPAKIKIETKEEITETNPD
jgi:tetratricopeptide (TPR) repeat protein